MGLDRIPGTDPLFPSSFYGRVMGLTNQPPDLLPGTLDLLILRALVAGPLHGYGIADRLKIVSQDVLQVGESSLYPALQRLLLDGRVEDRGGAAALQGLLLTGGVKAEWGASENNRRARYYTLTAAGKKRLSAERAEFERLVFAIQPVLECACGF